MYKLRLTEAKERARILLDKDQNVTANIVFGKKLDSNFSKSIFSRRRNRMKSQVLMKMITLRTKEKLKKVSQNLSVYIPVTFFS